MKKFVVIVGFVLAALVAVFTGLAWFAIGKAEEAVNKMRTNAALKKRWEKKEQPGEEEEEEEEAEQRPAKTEKEVTNE